MKKGSTQVGRGWLGTEQKKTYRVCAENVIHTGTMNQKQKDITMKFIFM